jgi:hypothetical protein
MMRNRADQIADLRALAELKEYDFEKARDILTGHEKGDRKAEVVVVRGGRGRFVNFGWFYVSGLDDRNPSDSFAVVSACVPAIWRQAQRPEGEWFENLKEREVWV